MLLLTIRNILQIDVELIGSDYTAYILDRGISLYLGASIDT